MIAPSKQSALSLLTMAVVWVSAKKKTPGAVAPGVFARACDAGYCRVAVYWTVAV